MRMLSKPFSAKPILKFQVRVFFIIYLDVLNARDFGYTIHRPFNLRSYTALNDIGEQQWIL
jgi:hypothetical protein